MMVPHLNCFGRALPVAWQQAIVRRARGLDLAAIVSDLFLDYPPKGLDLPAALRATRSMEEATREADVAGTKAAIVGWRI